MKKRPKRITPEMLASLSSDETRGLKALLETLDRPKLARVSGTWPPATPLDPRDLEEAIEAGNKRLDAMTPEEPAAEAAQREKDEADLLDWYDNRGGKKQQLHPMIEGEIRIARAKREPPADNSQTPGQEYDALAAQAPKPAEPALEADQEQQGEALKPLVIEREERRPTSIMEALNRPTREPMQIGESLGSWRR